MSEIPTSGGVNEHNATPSLKRTIKDALSEQIAIAIKRDRSETRKLHEIAIKPPVKRPITLALVDKTSTIPLKPSIQRIGENILAGTYEHDPLLQPIVDILKNYNQQKVNKLPKVWQQRFSELRLDEMILSTSTRY